MRRRSRGEEEADAVVADDLDVGEEVAGHEEGQASQGEYDAGHVLR